MEKPTHADIWKKLDDVCGDISDIKKALGSEWVENGKPVGNGLCGRVIRTEVGVSAYQSDKRFVLGAVAALTITATVLFNGIKAWITSWFPAA